MPNDPILHLLGLAKKAGRLEIGEEPVINSRYSIVIATAKRARQIIGGDEPMIAKSGGRKPLSVAVQELYEGKVKIVGEDEAADEATQEHSEV